MCAFTRSSIRFARLYNPRHRAKQGFFSGTQKQQTPLRVRDEYLGRHASDKVIQHYGFHVMNEREKTEDLSCTIARLVSEHPKQKICIYALQRHHKTILQSINGVQKFPDKKPLQAIMLRKFRNATFSILLADGMTGKLPIADIVIHFDLPKSPVIMRNRIQPQNFSILFYTSSEKITLAHIQNALKAIVSRWHLPSKKQQLLSFVDGFGDMVNMLPLVPTNLQFGDSGTPKYGLLAALIYFLYRKLSKSRKQYLLYDPSFRRFKNRKDVEDFLCEMGITRHHGVILTKKGFVVDSYEMLMLPLSHETAYEPPSIKRLRKKINNGCLTSNARKRKALRVLRRHQESHIIRAFKTNVHPPLQHRHTH